MCEMKGSLLVGLRERGRLVEMEQVVGRNQGRSREQWWTAGNDIEREGVWEWAGGNHIQREVGSWGWGEGRYNSPEENCLSWSVSQTGDSFWQGASCCNSLKYICELVQ